MFSYTTCFFVIALLVLYNIVVVFHYNRISDTREMGLEAKQTLFDQEESGEQRNEDVGAYERILAVGDLHGDLKALCAVLLASEVVNDEGDWIGGSTTLVQTGDIMDRTRGAITHEDEASERLMVEWLYHLGEQAKKEGGQVHMLLGNHELMNIEGQMNYASQENVKDFGGMYNRIAAFAPGGPFARTMAERHK